MLCFCRVMLSNFLSKEAFIYLSYEGYGFIQLVQSHKL